MMTGRPYEEHYFQVGVQPRGVPPEGGTLIGGTCRGPECRVPGSIEKPCEQCGVSCWIGPVNQQAVEAGALRVSCLPCATDDAILRRKAGEDVEFRISEETLEEVARTMRDDAFEEPE